MFIKTIILPFRIFQLFSFSPFGLSDKGQLPTDKLQLRIISVLMIFIHFASLIHGVIYTDMYCDWSMKPALNYYNVLCMVHIRLIALIILIESLLKQRHQMDFLEKIRVVDMIFEQKLSIGMEYKRHRRTITVRTGIWLILCFGGHTTLLIIWLLSEDYYSINFWLLSAIQLFMRTFHYLQLITYVHLTRIRFEMINEIIKAFYRTADLGKSVIFKVNCHDYINKTKNCLEMSNENSVVVEKYLIFKKLNYLREIYVQMFNATEMINHLFRCSIAINVAKDFLDTLSCVYWLCLWFLSPAMSTLYLTIGGFVIILLNIFHIISIANECYYTVEQVTILMYHFLFKHVQD